MSMEATYFMGYMSLAMLLHSALIIIVFGLQLLVDYDNK